MTNAIAIVSLVASIVTIWLTMFRRGTVKMAQPAFVHFGPDGIDDPNGLPKVTVCTNLYATADRGRIIESFHACVSRTDVTQVFDVWVYGADDLHRGSGVYVGRTGVTGTHHLLLPDGQPFEFLPGGYRVQFFAKLVGDQHPKCLFAVELNLPDEASKLVRSNEAAAFFEWRPAEQAYALRLNYTQDLRQRRARKFASAIGLS